MENKLKWAAQFLPQMDNVSKGIEGVRSILRLGINPGKT